MAEKGGGEGGGDSWPKSIAEKGGGEGGRGGRGIGGGGHSTSSFENQMPYGAATSILIE